MPAPIDGWFVYEHGSPDSAYSARLTEIAALGFKGVLNYDLLSATAANITAYINAANALGLKVIIALNNPAIWKNNAIAATYPELYANSGNQSTDQGFTTYVVNLVKNLAGTWGYYVGDEVVNSDHAALKLHAGYIKTADPNKPRLLIESVGIPANAVYNGNSTQFDCCDVIGDDLYDIGSNAVTWPSITTVAKGIDSNATAHGLQSAIVIQGFSWQAYDSPGQNPHHNTNYPYGEPWPTRFDERLRVIGAQQYLSNFRVGLMYSYFDIKESADLPQHRLHDVGYACNGVGNQPPSALAFGDTFFRASQNGWGTSSNGVDVWTDQTLTNTVSVVNNADGQITGSAGSSILTLGTRKLTNLVAQARMRLTSSNMSTIFGGFDVRRADGNNHVRIEIGGTAIRVRYDKAGVSTVTADYTGSPLTSGNHYWIQAQCIDQYYCIKVWPDETAEPAAFTVCFTDSGYVAANSNGIVGLFASCNTAGDNVQYEHFLVSVQPSPAPLVIAGRDPTITLKGRGE